MINHYTIEKTLGSGSFAKVKLARSSFLGKEQPFAVKIFKKAILRKQKEFYKDADGSKANFILIFSLIIKLNLSSNHSEKNKSFEKKQ